MIAKSKEMALNEKKRDLTEKVMHRHTHTTSVKPTANDSNKEMKADKSQQYNKYMLNKLQIQIKFTREPTKYQGNHATWITRHQKKKQRVEGKK
jgi:hypothetical protein